MADIKVLEILVRILKFAASQFDILLKERKDEISKRGK